MKKRILKIAMMAALTVCAVTSIALADDFKTVNGKEYKNATVRRIEPDGVVFITKVGISKVYFTELPKNVQERFHYDPVRAAALNVAVQAAVAQSNANAQQEAAAKEKAAKAQFEKAQREAQARQAVETQAPPPRVGWLQSVGGG
jgi:hypothetical protein